MKVIRNDKYITIIPDDEKVLVLNDEKIDGEIFTPLDFDINQITEIEKGDEDNG